MAFAAVAYLVVRSEQQVEVALIAGKSRIGPSKQRFTIPRMELMGVLTGARLAAKIVEDHSIKINERFFWCDNKPVLQWIRSGETWKLKQYTACRVMEIQQLTKASEWRYVPSKSNFADDAARWNGDPDLTSESRWFKGPDFLKFY